MSDTPETDELVRKYMTVIGTDAIGMASKLTLKCMDLERRLDVAIAERNAMRDESNKYIQLWHQASKDLETLKFGSVNANSLSSTSADLPAD
jgi:hypothetical protein